MLWWATFIAWTAVEEDDPWQLLVILGLVGVSFMFAGAACEDFDGASFGSGVILGHVEEVFGDF